MEDFYRVENTNMAYFFDLMKNKFITDQSEAEEEVPRSEYLHFATQQEEGK
jgi:hypothetical protein